MPSLNPKTFKRASFPNYFDPSRKIRPTAIVLHWWEEPISNGGIDYFIGLFAKRELSVQFVVMVNGDIYQMTPQADNYGRHAKCANESAIGIEIQGQGPQDLDSNQAQFEQVVRLVKYLQDEFDIQTAFKVEDSEEDIRFYGITSHKNVDAYCPNASGKQDVHDEYLDRVVEAISW